MDYKKLVSLLAVSTLALSACGTTEEAEEPATEEVTETEEAATEETATEEPAEEDASEETEGSSTEDLLQQAQDQAGEAFPEYGLYVAGGWTQDGIVVQHAPGEAATVPVQVTTEHSEYNVYLVEDGVITEVVSDEPEPAITVESPSADTEYVVGISPDDLGEVGDEVNTEDFYRSEVIIFEEAEPAPEAEEE